ncbi:hypothetical protein BH11ACT3_BH11ACT3_19130 [soil metagenome]
MTFQTAIVTVFRKFADFTGRAGRAEFWWFTLFTVLVSGALKALTPTAPYIAGDTDRFTSGVSAFTIGSAGINLAAAWSVVVLLPMLAVTVRRLRDVGRRWTQLFWLLLPIVGAIILIVRLAEPTRPAAIEAGVAPTSAPAG